MRHYCSILVIFLCILASSGYSVAQSSTTIPYTGLNILFVVDQSGSMSGLTTNVSDASDPQNLRFVAAQYAVDWLSDFRDTLVVEAGMTRPLVNLSVVYFGTDPLPILEWTAINTDNPNWRTSLQERIREDLSVERFGNNWHLTDTDFNAAFLESESSLIGVGSLPNAGSNPLNTVVVITDGGPCTKRDGNFLYDDNGVTRYTCMINNSVGVNVLGTQEARLSRLQNFVSTNLPSTDFRYYLIALDADGAYWPELADNWQPIICDSTHPKPTESECTNLHSVRVNTPLEMGQQMNRVLTDIAQQLVPTSIAVPCILTPPENKCDVPPYIQLMRINTYKNNAEPLGSQIEIRRPNSAVYSPLIPQRADTPIESYVIENPEAGTWEINLTNNTAVAQILVDFIPAGVRMQPITDLQVFESHSLVLEMVDGNNNSLAVDPTYPVTMTAQVYDATLPDVDLRPSVGRPITLTPSGNTFSGIWIPQVAGNHEIRVTAVYQTSDGNLTTFISDRSVLDNLNVVGTTIDWATGGITPTDVGEGSPIFIRGIARNTETGEPIQNTSAMQVRLTVTDMTNPAVFDVVILPNESDLANAGLVQATHQIATRGDYQLSAEVGVADAETGDFIPLMPLSPTQFVKVNAPIPISIQILQPSKESHTAQHFSLDPLVFDFSMPTVIQVQVTNQFNETLSLNTVTSGQVSLPTVILNPETDANNYTSQLSEILPGVYTVTLEDLPMGRYNINASVERATPLTGYYIWSTSEASKTFNRTLHPAIPITLGILIGLLLVVLVVGGWLFNRWQQARQNPLRGTLHFYIKYTNGQVLPVQQLNLETKQANEQVFTKLRAPFKRIKLSTHNNPQVFQKGDLYIDELEFTNAEPLSRNIRIQANSDFRELGVSAEGDMAYLVKLSSKVSESGGGDTIRSLRNDD